MKIFWTETGTGTEPGTKPQLWSGTGTGTKLFRSGFGTERYTMGFSWYIEPWYGTKSFCTDKTEFTDRDPDQFS